MEQPRHRLTDGSPQGQRCSADQNTLKRTDLDDFVNCYFGCSGAVSASESKASAVTDRRYSGNRHDREETERFKSFTYEELITPAQWGSVIKS